MSSGKPIGLSDLLSVSIFQPNSSGFSCLGSILIVRHNIVWKWALFTFSMNASLVGGRKAKFGEDEWPLPFFFPHTGLQYSQNDDPWPDHELPPLPSSEGNVHFVGTSYHSTSLEPLQTLRKGYQIACFQPSMNLQPQQNSSEHAYPLDASTSDRFAM